MACLFFVVAAAIVATSAAAPAANVTSVLAEFNSVKNDWLTSTTSTSPAPVFRSRGGYDEAIQLMASLTDAQPPYSVACATETNQQFGRSGLLEIQSTDLGDELECMRSTAWMNVVMCRSDECQFACVFYKPDSL